MAGTPQLEQSMGRVTSILESLNKAIGAAPVDELLREDDTYKVPFGLRRAIARTAIYMLDEAKRRGAYEGLSPEERAAKEAELEEKRGKIRAQKEARRAKEKKKKEGAPARRRGQAPRFRTKEEYAAERNREAARRVAAMRAMAKRGEVPPRELAEPRGGRKPSKAKKIQAPEKQELRSLKPSDAEVEGRVRQALRGVRKGRSKAMRELLAEPKGVKGAAALAALQKRVRAGETSVGRRGQPGKKITPAALTRLRRAIEPVAPGRTEEHPRPGVTPGMHHRMRRPRSATPGEHPPMDVRSHGGEPIALKHGGHEWYQKEKAKDLGWIEGERQRRSAGEPGKVMPGPVRPHEGRPLFGKKKAGVVAKAGKLARMRHQEPDLRPQAHDVAKGYDPEATRAALLDRYPHLRGDPERLERLVARMMGPIKPHKDHPEAQRAAARIRPSERGDHHVDDSGHKVHSTGKKENKKFANATTFRDSDDDAMLHTDRSKKGSRGEADPSQFVFHGDIAHDPRQKWYRVSKEGGYASAMASLGKSYHKPAKMRTRVISKVKSTGFVDSQGHQIDVKPTGSLWDERAPCKKDRHGQLSHTGKVLKKTDPSEFYRLCKGTHDTEGGEPAGGTKKGRIEYMHGFKPQHDDAGKIHRLHKAASAGKADIPERNIARHAAARPIRRATRGETMRRIAANAARTSFRLRTAAGNWRRRRGGEG